MAKVQAFRHYRYEYTVSQNIVLAPGISEEKCNDLEAEETAAEIEEERARKENILLYLDHCNEQVSVTNIVLF